MVLSLVSCSLTETIEILKKHPCCKISKQIPYNQVSSAAVERLFSIGGKIFRPDRCRLNDETFERLIMIGVTVL